MGQWRKKPVVIEAYHFGYEPPPEWWAEAIALGRIQVFDAGNFANERAQIETLEGQMRADIGDWIIQGVNGEIYPCKPDIFAKTYQPVGENADKLLTFGDAIYAAQAGYAIAREGWNGKGMFVVLMPPLYLPPFNTQDTARKVNDRTAKWIGEDAPLDCQPYFAMYTAAKQWQPGWLASQADMLANDWMVVDGASHE